MAGQIELHHGANLSHLIKNFFKDHSELIRQDGSCLYLASDSARVMELKKEYFLKESGGIASDFPFLTYSNFLNRLFEKSNIPARPADSVQQAVILQEIAAQKKNDFGYFDYPDQQIPNGMIKSLLQFFDEVRLNDADDKILSHHPSRLPLTPADRLQNDLSVLFADYQKIVSGHLLDEAELLRRLTQKISQPFFLNFFPGLQTIIWEDVSFFKESHLLLVRKLSEIGVNVLLLFPYGTNPEIFQAKEPLFQKLKKISDATAPFPDSDGLSDSLFSIEAGKLAISGRISITKPVDPLRETESLAGEIRKVAADNNWRFSDIAVSSPVLPAYRSLLEAVFRRYKIPFTFNEVRFIDQTLVIQHFLLIPELVLEDYPLLTVRKILQSPFFNYNESLKDTKYKDILNSLRARGGKKEILELLKRERAFYTGTGRNSEPGEAGMKRYDPLIQNITQLFRQAEFYEQPQSADSIYKFWSDFIAHHQVTRRIQRESGEEDSAWMEENLAALRSFLEALNNWKTIIREYYPGRRFDVREFSNILELMLGSASYRLRRPQNYGVQITPLKNLPTGKSKTIFILGMKDGVFPGKGSPGFTHPQTIARELKSFLPDETIYRERELFLKILHSDAEIIQFSSPRYHQDNPVLPSAFLREIERISDGPLSVSRDIRLYTPADILTKIIRLNRNMDLKKFESSGLTENLQGLLHKNDVEQFNFLKSVEKRREIPDDNSQWEGMLEGDEVISRWLDAVYKSRRFSVTQLEEYARCPIIYFFKRILHLEPEEEADELLTPLDRGITVHNILFRFYHENAAEQRDLSRLLAIAEEELEMIPVPHSILWQLQKEFYLGSSRHRGLFPAFWEYEQETAGQYSTVPKHFELSFGNTRELKEDADPASSTEPFLWEQDGEKFYFKGKIDRVEISDDGALLVVDYKTGTAPNTSSIWEGQNLQLPIYLKAVFDLLKDQYPVLDVAGGAYYSLKKEQDIRKKIVFLDSRVSVGGAEAGKSVILPSEKYAVDDVPVSPEEFLERSLGFAAGYIRNIRSGKFPHTMDETQCRGWNGRICEYLPLCRVNWRKQAAISRRSSRENDGQEESPR